MCIVNTVPVVAKLCYLLWGLLVRWLLLISAMAYRASGLGKRHKSCYCEVKERFRGQMRKVKGILIPVRAPTRYNNVDNSASSHCGAKRKRYTTMHFPVYYCNTHYNAIRMSQRCLASSALVFPCRRSHPIQPSVMTDRSDAGLQGL